MATIPPVSYLELNGPHSFAEYVGDGSTTQFSIPFPYLDRAHIHVLVDDTDTEFSFLSDGTVSVTPAPAVDASVVVQRRTPATLPSVSHAEGSLLRGSQLNLSTKQLLYAIQENADAKEPARAALLRADLAAADGAALVSFLADGTGAVARTALAKMRETVSVRDFGAVGDGVTDDTAAIQSAIVYAASVGNPTVMLGPGTFVISGAGLGARNGMTLQGAGPIATKLKLAAGAGNVNPIVRDDVVASVFQPALNVTLRGIHFEGNGNPAEQVAAASALVRFYSSTDLMVDDCWFSKSRNYGLGLQGFTGNTDADRRGPNLRPKIRNSMFFDNGLTSYLLPGDDPGDGLDFKSSTDALLENTYFFNNGDTGCDVRGEGAQHVNCWAYGNAGNGFSIRKEGGGLADASAAYTNCISRDNGGGGFIVSPEYGAATPLSKVWAIYTACQSYRNPSNIVVASVGALNQGEAHVVVTGGVYRDATSARGIICSGPAASLIINGNLITGNVAGGVLLASTHAVNDPVSITGNVLDANTGIHLSLPYSTTVPAALSGNVLVNGGGQAIVQANGGGSIISGNQYSNNTGNNVTLNDAIKRFDQPNGPRAVASAATITLSNDTDVFSITGTTGITSITAARTERVVYLRFTGTLTVTDGSNLYLNGNFSATPDDELTLISNGTNWYELARSNN